MEPNQITSVEHANCTSAATKTLFRLYLVQQISLLQQLTQLLHPRSTTIVLIFCIKHAVSLVSNMWSIQDLLHGCNTQYRIY